MKRLVTAASAAAIAVLAVAGAASSEQGDERWVRGKLIAISGSSITVSSSGKDMEFTTDKETDIIQEGAGTKTREAQREGRAGVPLDTLLKVGERVEVHYRDRGGKLYATEIRGGIAAGDAMGGGTAREAQTGTSARGSVTAISDTSLTIKTGDGERTFAVGDETRVEGPRFGTMTREMQKKGEKPTLTKFIRSGDYVTVRYREAGGKLMADEVRLVQRLPGRDSGR